MKNILITGGAGFIGSNFVRLLNENAKYRIINLDKLTYAGSLDNLAQLPNPAQHHFVTGDICQRELIDELLSTYEIDTIVHFAAESHVDRSISGPACFIETNLIGTFTLLEAARHYWQGDFANRRFHHISTDEVYGTLEKHDPAFTEATAYQPNSPYSASKAGSDHLVNAYHVSYGLPTTISNCSNNYGPYQHTEKLIPTVITACLQQQAIPIYGDGSNIRDWLYVDDHCHAIASILTRGKLGETYNIGGDNEWSNLALVKKICQLLDDMQPAKKSYESLIKFVTDRPGHDWRYAINSTKLKSALNWQPQQSLDSGLRKTINFYLAKYKSEALT